MLLLDLSSDFIVLVIVVAFSSKVFCNELETVNALMFVSGGS
jgi:hypothetical protein